MADLSDLYTDLEQRYREVYGDLLYDERDSFSDCLDE